MNTTTFTAPPFATCTTYSCAASCIPSFVGMISKRKRSNPVSGTGRMEQSPGKRLVDTIPSPLATSMPSKTLSPWPLASPPSNSIPSLTSTLASTALPFLHTLLLTHSKRSSAFSSLPPLSPPSPSLPCGASAEPQSFSLRFSPPTKSSSKSSASPSPASSHPAASPLNSSI